MRSIATLVAAMTMALGAGPADAEPTICERAYTARIQVIRHYGEAAAGRNICRNGVVRHRHRRGALTVEKYKYLLQLQNMLKKAPAYLFATGRGPGQAPAGVFRRSYVPIGLAACIVNHESGGDTNATNGQYRGIAQWSPEAWARHGGRRYAQDPRDATWEQQLLILSNGLVRYGCRDWCPFDSC